jgi:hypothetical protein
MSNVINLPGAERANTLSDSAALAQIAELLTFNGKTPADAMEIVKLVASFVRVTKEHGRIIHDMTVANQAAWIEWKHGGGADAAMEWVENGLEGPGLLPGSCEDDIDEADPILKNPQGYYDRYSSWNGGKTGNADRIIGAMNDRELLDFMEANLVTVKCVNIPTPGGDDADTAFEVIQYHMAAPRERTIGYASTAREAIRAAIRATDPQGDLFAQEGAPA